MAGTLGNNISDISALAGLTNLIVVVSWVQQHLGYLSVGGINQPDRAGVYREQHPDISALAGLTNLTALELVGNNISDLSALAGLTNLTRLQLSGNNISDPLSVGGINQPDKAAAFREHISDISALAGLTNLTALYLRDNSILDISPLVANTGLGSGDTVDVQRNP